MRNWGNYSPSINVYKFLISDILKPMKIVSFLKRTDPYLLFIIVITSLLRLINLGYSDYFGDEIKALLRLNEGESFVDFFLRQRKGPVQFIITFLTHYINPSYKDELITRLPFAILGILAVVFLYLFVRYLFGRQIAFYSAFFLAVNGFFVALSRIAQYQSAVIFFSIFCLYSLELANRNYKFRYFGIYLSLFSWAIALLSHYDGIFILPIVFFMIFRWFTIEPANIKEKIIHFIFAGTISMGMLLVFYLPYFNTIQNATVTYWSERISPSPDLVYYNTIYLFKVYQPIFALPLYSVCGILGFFHLVSPYLKPKWNWLEKFTINLEKPKSPFFYFVLLWFVFALSFYEIYVKIPGTHIYTYLIPLSIFVGAGFDYLVRQWGKISEGINNKFHKLTTATIICLVFSFLFLQSWMIYVDSEKEYPWEPEQFLFWDLQPPASSNYLYLYGFPYNRAWSEIGEFIKQYPDIYYYYTNEKSTIARFYVQWLLYDQNLAGFYILVEHPQSLIQYTNGDKAFHWVENNDPLKYIYSEGGKLLARIYIMPEGTLDELKERGQ